MGHQLSFNTANVYSNIHHMLGEIHNPYNDGWTQELYKELYEKELKKIKRYEQNRSKQVTN